MAFLARSWLAAGGQQWGPRYLLVLYPLLTIAAVAGLTMLHRQAAGGMRLMLVAYLSLVAIGVGFEVRGQQAVWTTVQNYRLTQQALRQLDETPKLTECIWLPMVIPELYWRGDIFARHGQKYSIDDWRASMQQKGATASQFFDMDMCLNAPLDEIENLRKTNPSGIVVDDLNQH